MVIGILISLVLLMLIAYRGLSVILFAPFCAMLAALTAGYDVLPMYSEIFMSSAGAYVKNFFPLFMLGAVFGKVMEDSGHGSFHRQMGRAEARPSRPFLPSFWLRRFWHTAVFPCSSLPLLFIRLPILCLWNPERRGGSFLAALRWAPLPAP